MREIKFRAWLEGKCSNSSIDTPIKTPFMIYDAIINSKGQFADVNADGSWYLYPDSPVMQCTGLKDKNGFDIYDGDVLEASYDRVMQVVWCASFKDSNGNDYSRDHFARWELKTLIDPHTTFKSFGFTAMNDFFYPKSVVKLIGNIYENPELLKNKEQIDDK